MVQHIASTTNRKFKPNIMNIKCTNLDWDTDGEEVEGLPKEVIFEVDEDYVEEMVSNGVERDEVIGEVLIEDLSDTYGYCLNGLDWTEEIES